MNYQVSEEFIKEAYAAACKEWKEKLEAEFPKVFPKITHTVGTRYMNNLDKNEYMLVRANEYNGVTLVNIRTGNIWSTTVEARRWGLITNDEFKIIASSATSATFTKI